MNFNWNKNKKYTGNRASSLVKMLAVDKTNKLESIPFVIEDEKIKKVLDDTEFESVRERLGMTLSQYGEAIMVILPYSNTYVIEVLKVTQYSRVGKFNILLEGTSGSTIQYKGNDVEINTRLSFVDNKPTLSRYFVYEDEVITHGEDYVFKGNTLPGEYFFNNQEKKSDAEFAGVIGDLERLAYHDDKLQSEWERTRTMPVFNSNFTDDDPKLETSNIDNGKGYIEENSYNSKFGLGKQMLPATQGTVILQQQIIMLEDDIKVKLGMARDTINSGSNSHNLEVVMSNQFGTELLLRQKLVREKSYNSFFAKLAMVLNTTAPIVELQLSKVENAKLLLLDASIQEAEMKAQNINSQVVATAEKEGE